MVREQKWHKYPEDKPTQNKPYIVAFNAPGGVGIVHWSNGGKRFMAMRDEIYAWMEMSETPKNNKDSNWHKYPEDKPTQNKPYIVAINKPYDIGVVSWSNNKNNFDELSDLIYAWMEMPEPPKNI